MLFPHYQNGRCVDLRENSLHRLRRYRNRRLVSIQYINGLVQERRNSSAFAMEFRVSCNNPSISSCCLISHWEDFHLTVLSSMENSLMGNFFLLMAQYSTTVTSLLTHWSYHSLALSHWYTIYVSIRQFHAEPLIFVSLHLVPEVSYYLRRMGWLGYASVVYIGCV